MGLRPGRRARWVAVHAAYGGGAVGTLGAAGWGLLLGEARLARRAIGEPTEQAPDPDGLYGTRARGRRRPLGLVVLGDSSAAGLGCDVPEQTPGALLAGGLARELGRPVRLAVHAVVGAESADLPVQVSRAMSAGHPVDAVVVMVGANDVTHRVAHDEAAADLGRTVRALREAGAVVVVGTCPDLGTVEPLLQPLRGVAAYWSRRMARAQTVAVVEAGGVTVSLGDLLGPEFGTSPHLWSEDRFHPSPEGYGRVAEVLLPTLLDALGQAGSTPVRDSVQDLRLAATAASRDPGLVVETVEGEQGAGTAGPGRLARLRRRVPLVGRGAPEARAMTGDDPGLALEDTPSSPL